MDRRLHQVLTATTRHEIASALASLPAEDPGTTSTISAAAGRIQRRGEWRVPRTLKVQSAFGRVQLDLSRAVFEHRVVDLELHLGTGGAKITVGPLWGAAEIRLAIEPPCGHGVRGQDRVAPAVVDRLDRGGGVGGPSHRRRTSSSRSRRTATGPSGRSRSTVYPMSPAPKSLCGGDALGAVGQQEPVEQGGVVRVRHVGGGVGPDRLVRGLPHQLDRAAGDVGTDRAPGDARDEPVAVAHRPPQPLARGDRRVGREGEHLPPADRRAVVVGRRGRGRRRRRRTGACRRGAAGRARPRTAWYRGIEHQVAPDAVPLDEVGARPHGAARRRRRRGRARPRTLRTLAPAASIEGTPCSRTERDELVDVGRRDVVLVDQVDGHARRSDGGAAAPA